LGGKEESEQAYKAKSSLKKAGTEVNPVERASENIKEKKEEGKKIKFSSLRARDSADTLKLRWAIAIGLLLLTVSVFWGVLGLAFINFDDPDQ
jgi:hypothetical protein